jgi:hypothetical protein
MEVSSLGLAGGRSRVNGCRSVVISREKGAIKLRQGKFQPHKHFLRRARSVSSETL